ncbi:hypothetical protein GCM10011450_13660 [Advenella faeciporci]|uniref:Uncharacterized protein n=1 Tax=Advenella faeciporci TaxID=797535 RepID=A0A918JM45_9BURK|nr:hypothetical protein GCM10011450_13660 [Advenella faeciporci]
MRSCNEVFFSLNKSANNLLVKWGSKQDVALIILINGRNDCDGVFYLPVSGLMEFLESFLWILAK